MSESQASRTASSAPILWTLTDEAPALATYSFLPIVRTFAGAAGVPVETRDISLSGRILAAFPDRLSAEQRIDDRAIERFGQPYREFIHFRPSPTPAPRRPHPDGHLHGGRPEASARTRPCIPGPAHPSRSSFPVALTDRIDGRIRRPGMHFLASITAR